MTPDTNDVDERGNCSKCGGTHYGTGRTCVFDQPSPTTKWPQPEPDPLMHASAPSGHKCADCTIDGKACRDCLVAGIQALRAQLQTLRGELIEGIMYFTNPRKACRVGASWEETEEGWSPWIGAISLFRMIQLFAYAYYSIAEHLAEFTSTANRMKNREATLDAETCAIYRDGWLADIRSHCAKAGLTVSVRAVEEFSRKLDPKMRVTEIAEHTAFLRKAIKLELESIEVYQVEKGRIQFLEASAFGPSVADGFPSAVFDINEAARSYKYDLPTACVFHLMRIMEAGLRAIGKSLGNLPSRPDWDAVLVQAEKRLTNGTAPNKPFLIEATAQLRAVKRAWRNGVMHVGSEYSDGHARDIYIAVKAFMQHLATEIREV